MSKVPERATQMLQEVWRRASKLDEPLRIPCPNEAAAVKLRFALYAAVKDAKREDTVCDEPLREAARSCMIRLDGDIVVIQNAKFDATMQGVLDILGPGFEPKSSEDLALEASAKRLEQELGTPGGGQRPANPYYTRGD
ncbi:hypothetical protein [Bacteriophage sp.]|nr:hypothetical protein [Bacteriophage sp.]